MNKIRIAIEATGADKGFHEVLEGARKAYEKDNGLEIILVGGEDRIAENWVPGYLNLEVADYTYFSGKEVKGKVSSIQKAIEMHRNAEVEAVIAPGDTKGAVLYGTKILRRVEGIKMPAIAAHLPFNNVLIDAGANLQSKPRHLFQNAIMGNVFARHYLGVESPLISLVSVGHELRKGDELILESRKLIEGLKGKEGYNIHDFHFEGSCVKSLYGGEVRITDGKSGNIMLKEGEGIIEAMIDFLKKQYKGMNWMRKALLALSMRKDYNNMKKNFDWKEYAVCPLLGVEGNVMICHGKSDSDTIANAILLTKKYLGCGINERIREEISKYR